MAITLWKNKKSPLSIEEMDNNFEELCQRIESLEKSPHMPPEGITSVIQKDQDLFFMGSRGSTLGKVSISQPQWTPRGKWEKKQEYEKYDLIQHDTGLYLCHTSHTSEEFFVEEHWTLLYEKKDEDKKPMGNESDKAHISFLPKEHSEESHDEEDDEKDEEDEEDAQEKKSQDHPDPEHDVHPKDQK